MLRRPKYSWLRGLTDLLNMDEKRIFFLGKIGMDYGFGLCDFLLLLLLLPA